MRRNEKWNDTGVSYEEQLSYKEGAQAAKEFYEPVVRDYQEQCEALVEALENYENKPIYWVVANIGKALKKYQAFKDKND